MKVLIYVNKSKDPTGTWLNNFKKTLKNEGIQSLVISDDMLEKKFTADALFVLGGDGTILNLTKFSAINSIPIIGINAGKLGFLTEFERYDMDDAVGFLKKGKFVKDKRTIILCEINNKEYFALNDIVAQRIKIEERGNNVTAFDVEIDGVPVEKIVGDGVIVSTPTGSTAYSLSAGGAILSPGINVFSITPLAAHSLNQRSIVYSAKSLCKINVTGRCATGLFVDGIFAEELFSHQEIVIKKFEFPVIFLRKKGFNFYRRLSYKLNDRTVDGNDKKR